MRFTRNQKIKIGKHEFPIRITNRAILEYEELSKDKHMDLTSVGNTLKFLYCIIKAGCKNERKKFDYDYEQFLEMIDDFYAETMTGVIDILNDEFNNDDLEEDKKKSSGEPINWEEIYGYCVGECGITPQYFLDDMSQDEIAALMKTRFKIKTDDIRMSWEQTRILAYYSSFDKINVKTLKKFMPFEWDIPDAPVKIIPPEERDRRLKEIMQSKKLRYGQN